MLPDDMLVGEFYLLESRAGAQDVRHGPFQPPIRIGSAAGNDVRLSDPAVSRHHCALERVGSGLRVRDSGSSNGTWISGVRVGHAWLTDGARLRLGETELTARRVRSLPVDMSLYHRFEGLIGDSQPMRELFALLERIAPREVPVLIEGETGTGKELVARAIHARSARSKGPFIIVDCGALAPTLVESELFGHVKGAFTGAGSAREGAFAAANGGTLFLDELGELDAALQPKLLRVLESGQFKPLGASTHQTTSIRLVAATHRDLRRMVNTDAFREDLYYRVAVCPISVPALRARPGDVAVLARHFLTRSLFGADADERAVPEIDPASVAMLQARGWPGNVRELRNAIERAVILSDPKDVERGDLRAGLGRTRSTAAGSTSSTLEDAKRQFERQYLVELLARHGSDITSAAKAADVHPKSLTRLLRRHQIRRP